MPVTVYGPQDHMPIELPIEPERTRELHARRILPEIDHRGPSIEVAIWRWEDSPYYLLSGGVWRLTWTIDNVPMRGRVWWNWGQIVAECMTNRWLLCACPGVE